MLVTANSGSDLHDNSPSMHVGFTAPIHPCVVLPEILESMHAQTRRGRQCNYRANRIHSPLSRSFAANHAPPCTTKTTGVLFLKHACSPPNSRWQSTSHKNDGPAPWHAGEPFCNYRSNLALWLVISLRIERGILSRQLRFHHRRDSITELIDIRWGDSRNIDPPASNDVDAELVLQAIDLQGIQSTE